MITSSFDLSYLWRWWMQVLNNKNGWKWSPFFFPVWPFHGLPLVWAWISGQPTTEWFISILKLGGSVCTIQGEYIKEECRWYWLREAAKEERIFFLVATFFGKLFLELLEKFFFLSGHALNPPPLRGRAIKKITFIAASLRHNMSLC